MARRNRRNRILVPESRSKLEAFKAEVMHSSGYATNSANPETLKYEVAKSLGVPLKPGYNGSLEAAQAGKVGGTIGGAMVRELIRMAQQQLKQQ